MSLDLTLVNNEVAAQIAQGLMFTAYDVTKVLRKAGVWCKHFEVRDEVHNLFANGDMGPDYKRTNALVSSNGDYAWIYHHYMDDPNDYANPSVSPANANSVTNVVPKASTVSSVVSSAVSSILSSKASVPTGSYSKSVDTRGRLLIEKRHISALGLNPGNEAYVYLHGVKIEVTEGSYVGGTLLNVYIVDKDGAVRLGSRILKELGSLPSAYYRITPGNTKITIVA